MLTLRFAIACVLLAPGIDAYKWMEKIKLPTMTNIRRMVDAKKFGDKKLVVITGTSSGLGKATTKALLRSGKYHVVGGVRDMAKMRSIMEFEGFDEKSFTPMHLDLASFDSVHKFKEDLDKFRGEKPIDRLVCNAAVYQPSLDYPKWSKDDIEQQLQINFLSHFLLTSLVMEDMKGSEDPRVIMVGSVTGNDNTVGGGGVYPVADLKELEGLEFGGKNPISMIDGYNFNGAKAYKDTKLCLMMTANMLHDRFHRSTGIAFSSIYPGCIAESPLFREKRAWFRKYFPVFMKYVTGGYVGEEEAGQRLFQTIHDPRCKKSGVYWSWNGGPREGRGYEAIEKGGQIVGAGGSGGGWDSIFENDPSDKVLDVEKAGKLWKLSSEITGAVWPKAYQPKSPCPTLKLVGAATSILNTYEDMQRMKRSENLRVAMALTKDQNKIPDSDAEAVKTRRPLGLQRDTRGDNAPDLPFGSPEPIPVLASEKQPKKEKEHKLEPVPGLKFAGAGVGPGKVPGSKDNRQLGKEFFEKLSLKFDRKKPYTIPKGHELLGDIPVVFQPENKATMAKAGQPLSEVATQADVFIRYGCKKGECGTCAVNVDGKWVQACQTSIPPVSNGEVFGVTVRPVKSSSSKKKPSTFFSPASFVEGVVNNGLGMVGFAQECIGADPDFNVRMQREREIREMVAARKASQKPDKPLPQS
ncbi:hypothetical protein AAMO2058_001371200 [Amorphochlora amoebiformis]